MILSKKLTGIAIIMSIFLLTTCEKKEQADNGDKTAPEGEGAQSGELMKRSEIDQKYKWDLTDLYASEDE